MAEAIVSDVVVKLLEYMGQSAVQKIAPYFNGRKKLIELQQLMRMIQARLFDAERLREGENGVLIKLWLKRLKRVLFQLEDLFEEMTMADKENEQILRGKLTKPLLDCFSSLSPYKFNKRLALESKAAVEELKAITSEMQSLNLRVHLIDVQSQPSLRLVNKRETHSFMLEEEVIGREADKRAIMDMVLHSENTEESFSVIPIVGMGGLGKTTLAQIVFNDQNVQKHFELKGWACISDIYSVEELARKILQSINVGDYQQLCLDQLQARLRQSVKDKKFLLVLDDVWDEDRERWLCFRRLLRGCRRGSKIILTSRSRVAADNMGQSEPYLLGVLQEDMSWALFRSLAFKDGQESSQYQTSIGKEIVRKCGHVPLAIRTIAGLLHTKDTEQEWDFFKESELNMMEQCESNIMSSLKLSYDHLTPQLKQCFAYCSLFPKDYAFNKMDLIYLWMAQGFLESSEDLRSLENIGHGYFMELLRRSFFQEASRNKYGEIISCKMHDLMNDLAKMVAGDCCILLDKPTTINYHNTALHASFPVGSSWYAPPWLFAANQLRSLLLTTNNIFLSVPNISDIFSSLRCLRALDLPRVDGNTFPESIKELKHLRYLRLCVSSESLPECITSLKKLQTLDLRECRWLRELPVGFHKLTNLRHLRCRTSIELTHMPPGFESLTSLQTLDLFAVGDNTGLYALASLTNLAGNLKIRFSKHHGRVASVIPWETLKGKNLTTLELTWWAFRNGEPVNQCDEVEDELAISCLQPPSSLRRLKIEGWRGVRFPRWGMDGFPCSLPNLVSVEISGCERCRYLPSFSRLPHLKFLRFWYLGAVEYIDEGGNNSEAFSPIAFFPSLEHLVLFELPKLKGWSRMENDMRQHEPEKDYTCYKPHFPRLSELTIGYCLKLMSMPMAPRLNLLGANCIHKNLLNFLLYGDESETSASSLSTPSMLRSLHIRSIFELDTLSINSQSLKSLSVYFCNSITKLIAKAPISLQHLDIHNCGNLKDISRAFQHLTALEELRISDCEQLCLDYDKVGVVNEGRIASSTSDEIFPQFVYLQGLKTLHSLTLKNIYRLEFLPKSIG